MASHFSIVERELISKYLIEGFSLNKIAKLLNRDRTGIALEIKRNRVPIHKGYFGKRKIFCQKAWDKKCKKKMVCDHCPTPKLSCCFCQKCINYCKEYAPAMCNRIKSSPFCCNGCKEENKCTIKRYIYSPLLAQKRYEERLSDVRTGTCLNEKQLEDITKIVKDGCKKGQSIYNIVKANTDKIPCSVRTIYHLIRNGYLEVSLFDLPRTVQRKQRKVKKQNHKVDKNCRIGRTFNDYQDYLALNPSVSPVQMDTVEGVREDMKCFLSLSFPHLQLSLFYLMPRQSAFDVHNTFKWLHERLGEDNFKEIFPVILTDRGHEFSDPEKLEMLGTKVFYCDAMASHQKGHVENQNSLLRRIIPKGYFIDELNFEDSFLINSHLASYLKSSLKEKAPYDLLNFIHGEELCRALYLKKIPANEVILKPQLVKGKLKRKK